MSAPLIILPGLMCNGAMFAEQLAQFPESRAIEDYYAGCNSIEAMAEHALAQMPQRVSLLGHSMGARIALEIISRAPERVERLALVDTGVHPVAAGEQEKRFSLRDLGRSSGHRALIDAWLPPMLGSAARNNPALVEHLQTMCLSAGLDCYERQINALLHRPNAQIGLGAISCPTLVAVGEEDLWSPVSQHRDIAAAIPGSTLVAIAGAGHMLPAEQPDLFNNALRAWLAPDA